MSLTEAVALIGEPQRTDFVCGTTINSDQE
jgi:hypothetical protein